MICVNFPVNGGKGGCLLAYVFKAAPNRVDFLAIFSRSRVVGLVVAVLAAVFALVVDRNGSVEGIQNNYTVQPFLYSIWVVL